MAGAASYEPTVDISSLTAGGGAISYRPYTASGKWISPNSKRIGGMADWQQINTPNCEYYGDASTGWWGIVDNCTFINNAATNGGAIQIIADEDHNVTVKDSTFINNDANKKLYGALDHFILDDDTTHDEIMVHTIEDMTSGFGGAIFVSGSDESSIYIYITLLLIIIQHFVLVQLLVHIQLYQVAVHF